jgi:hypothetical protein
MTRYRIKTSYLSRTGRKQRWRLWWPFWSDVN